MLAHQFPQAAPLRVFLCIPNIGHTEALAYDNRLVWTMRMGAREERARWVHKLHYPGVCADPPALLEAITGHPAAEVLAEHRTWYEFYTYTVGEVLTPFARELLVERALEWFRADLICMVDDDMVGDPDTFFRLAESVVHGPADLCGALAFTRGAPHRPVLYRQLSGFDPTDHRAVVQNRAMERYPKDALVECDAVGFGAVVFTADLARKVAPPRFMNTTGSGEDIFFCYKARETAGARIFADTRVKLGHMGYAPVITEETFEAQPDMARKRERDGVEAADRIVADAPAWAVAR